MGRWLLVLGATGTRTRLDLPFLEGASKLCTRLGCYWLYLASAKYAKTHTSKAALDTGISLWWLNVVPNLDGMEVSHSEKP